MTRPIRELLKMARSEDRDDAFDGAAELAERVEAVIRELKAVRSEGKTMIDVERVRYYLDGQ